MSVRIIEEHQRMYAKALADAGVQKKKLEMAVKAYILALYDEIAKSNGALQFHSPWSDSGLYWIGLTKNTFRMFYHDTIYKTTPAHDERIRVQKDVQKVNLGSSQKLLEYFNSMPDKYRFQISTLHFTLKEIARTRHGEAIDAEKLKAKLQLLPKE